MWFIKWLRKKLCRKQKRNFVWDYKHYDPKAW